MIQPISSEDLFVWPCGVHTTRGQYHSGEYGYLGDDYEVVPVGSPRYDVASQDHDWKLENA